MRIEEQGARLTLQEHDDDDDDNGIKRILNRMGGLRDGSLGSETGSSADLPVKHKTANLTVWENITFSCRTLQ